MIEDCYCCVRCGKAAKKERGLRDDTPPMIQCESCGGVARKVWAPPLAQLNRGQKGAPHGSAGARYKDKPIRRAYE